jgi:hypothetical protein
MWYSWWMKCQWSSVFSEFLQFSPANHQSTITTY